MGRKYKRNYQKVIGKGIRITDDILSQKMSKDGTKTTQKIKRTIETVLFLECGCESVVHGCHKIDSKRVDCLNLYCKALSENKELFNK